MKIMAEDRVQLKQEEVIGSEVVLSDINPKTNTRSIDDPTTGTSLDKTVDRIWQAINNKLSRIVNSVNGRSGVVVLDASDVGLENVDNVSLADIKKWVINRMNQEFGYKRLILFEYLDEMETYISDNDETHQNKPFYSHHGFKGDDDRAYIGYIWWDPGTQRLKETHMVIDTVGHTDNSIIYNETVNDVSLDGGGIGVNIWKYEEALELYNDVSGAKADSGLRINPENMLGKVYYFNGVYGDGTAADDNALLYIGNATGVPSVTFNIHKSSRNEVLVIGGYLRQADLKYGDIIITNFSDDLYRDTDGNLLTGMNSQLVNRQPCIGYVSSAPSTKDRAERTQNNWMFTIDFYQLHVNLGWGLTYTENHIDPAYNNLNKDTEISIQLVKGIRSDETTTTPINVSGLNTFRSVPTGVDKKYVTMLPEGPKEVLSKTIGTRDGNGIMITPNYSLCVIPVSQYGNTSRIDNWNPSIPSTVNASSSDIKTDYMNESPSLLGVNLLKGVMTTPDGSSTGFINMSGLRINDTSELSETWGGSTSSIDESYRKNHSGGLSVNVGKFLEISPGIVPANGDKFYDGGKVNVSISPSGGLTDDGNNGLAVNISRPLYFDSDGKIALRLHDVDNKSLDERPNAQCGQGLEFVSNGINDSTDYGLSIKRKTNSALVFDNTGGIGVNVQYNKGLFIELGDGGHIAIKIRDNDTPGTYITNDVLWFDEKGYLKAPIDINSGLIRGDEGIKVKLGDGLTFDESGNIIPLLGPGLKFID